MRAYWPHSLRELFKPYLSLFIIIISLFSIVMIKMEVVRVGYVVLKESEQLKRLMDHKRMLALQWAEMTRPERVRQIAISRLTLSEARSGQFIQVADKEIAIRQ
ncbi:MAG: hypothetical protein D6797_04735 [Bdellovibrio sp.]|nr:MAG: hypothetical protein D6797_04735 [Bdellovibrio sp.]